ncbi:S-adenosyl-L-homocysteine hydrolase [Sphingorhabdus sp.]|uniref:S-adenosyl-L-homocysteine hydrolase n=1 Tax=Sphingorhabdus sp. TaxID=1902408 RepID=UPI0035944429
MMKSKKCSVVFAVGMAICSQPAQACWTNAAQDAAKIKHLNTMLMVTALRCRNTPDNFLPHYNRFVVKHNSLIGSQNTALKGHLAQTYGARGAEGALDRMSIGYANSYGNGHKNMDCKQLKDLASKLSSESHGVVTMAAAADIVITGQSWSGPACPVRIAKRP